jgi:hypothetical protein
MFYDPTSAEVCSENHPCAGMSILLMSSCVEHGGIVSMSELPETNALEFVGFIPPPAHDREGKVAILNYCPCCGRALREFTTGLREPTNLH